MTNLIIPDSIPQDRHMTEFHSWEMCIFIPYPDEEEGGFYINQSNLVALLRANKDNAAAVEYIADMLE